MADKDELTTDLEMRFCPKRKQLDYALVPGTVLGWMSTWATVSPQKGPRVGSSTGVGRLIIPSTFPTDPGWLEKLLMTFINKRVSILNTVLSNVFSLNER